MIEKRILLLSLSNEKNWNFDKNVYLPLKKVFSEVIRFEDYRQRCNLVGTEALQHEIIKLAEVSRPNYVLWPASMYEILEETFITLQKLDCKIIGWFFDDEVCFSDYSRWWLPYLDFVMTGSKESVPKYQNIGAKAFYVPIACNPDIYHFIKDSVYYEVSFVGRDIGNRRKLIKSIEDGGIAVDKFGLTPETVVSFENLIRIFSNSRINLNFTKSYDDGASRQLKARIFEVPMCGGFLLTEYVEGIEEHFEIDKEIACFETVNEAIEKINYYLTHENKRKTIAQAGFNRAHRDHTWEKRLAIIFNKIDRDMDDANRSVLGIQLKQPESLQPARSKYHYDLGKEWLKKNRTDLCISELYFASKFEKKSPKYPFLLMVCKLATQFSLMIFKIYDKFEHYCLYVGKKIRILTKFILKID